MALSVGPLRLWLRCFIEMACLHSFVHGCFNLHVTHPDHNFVHCYFLPVCIDLVKYILFNKILVKYFSRWYLKLRILIVLCPTFHIRRIRFFLRRHRCHVGSFSNGRGRRSLPSCGFVISILSVSTIFRSVQISSMFLLIFFYKKTNEFVPI